MSIDRIAVIGTGRVGLSLARALLPSGTGVTVLSRNPRPLPDPLPAARADWAAAIAPADLVLVAVPDDALPDVAGRLARDGAVTARHIVLHTSGLYDRTAFAALASSGAALGSWHPLQSFNHPDGEPGALAGSPVAIEGDARALAAGRELAEMLHLRPVVELEAGGKAAYHAGAVFASNYLVVLADIAARLAREAGAAAGSPRLYLPLMRHTLAAFTATGPAALTGPISRGDAGTVARHLDALTGAERDLYVLLGREALRIAVASGLEAEKARAIGALLY